MRKVTLWVCLAAMALLGSIALATPLATATTAGTMTANVIEQAVIAVPSDVAFDVQNIAVATTSAVQSVTVSAIVLTPGNSLRVSMKAGTTAFALPASGTGATWDAADVSANAAAWTGGTGAAITALSTSYQKLVETSGNPGTLSTTALQFTLASKAGVAAAGAHVLNVTWLVESF